MAGFLRPHPSFPERLVRDLGPLGVPEVPMLGRYDYKHAQHGLHQHAHPGAMEICYLAKGTQIYRVGRQDYVMRGGDVFVTFPGERHSTGEAPQEKGILYWMILLLPRAKDRFLHFPKVDAQAWKARLRALPHRHFSGTPRLCTQLDALLRLAGPDAAHDPLRRVALHVRLGDFLLEILECSRKSPRTGLPARMNSLLHLLETRIGEPPDVPEMAALLGLSVSRFKTHFKKEIGIPPAEYVLRCRVSQAKLLLKKPGATVTDVAYRLGFSSSQYFATVFKRYTGKNPRCLL